MRVEQINISQKLFTAKRPMNHNLKMDTFRMMLKGLLLVSQMTSLDHVDNFKATEMCLSNMIPGLYRVKSKRDTSLSVVDLSRASSEDGLPAAEEAMEATEEEQESPGQDTSQPGIYTEHVFTDPLGTESSGTSTGNNNQRWAGHNIIITADLYPDVDENSSSVGFLVRESDQDRDDTASAGGKTNLAKEEIQRMSSALPTMWLGAQNGWWDACTQIHKYNKTASGHT